LDISFRAFVFPFRGFQLYLSPFCAAILFGNFISCVPSVLPTFPSNMPNLSFFFFFPPLPLFLSFSDSFVSPPHPGYSFHWVPLTLTFAPPSSFRLLTLSPRFASHRTDLSRNQTYETPPNFSLLSPGHQPLRSSLPTSGKFFVSTTFGRLPWISDRVYVTTHSLFFFREMNHPLFPSQPPSPVGECVPPLSKIQLPLLK